MDIQLMLARYVLRQLHDEDLPSFAADALEAGYDSPTLRRLAGFDDKLDYVAIQRLLRQSLEELNISLPDIRQATMRCVREIARDVVEGRLSPYEGACAIACGALGTWIRHIHELSSFIGLEDEYLICETDECRQFLSKMILEECRQILATDQVQ